MPMTTVLVIPEQGPLYDLELGRDDATNLDILTQAVGGPLQFLVLPSHTPAFDHAAAYINEGGKFHPDQCKPNPRATALMMPGRHIAGADYIAGAMVLVGLGSHGEETAVPEEVATWVHTFCS